MGRPIPAAAVSFLKQHEALVLRVYDDAAPARQLKRGDHVVGTLTAGYGHTSQFLEIGQTVSNAEAEAWLNDDLLSASVRLRQVLGPDVDVIDELTEHQYAALLSFVFNLGASPSWTIWKRLKARQFDQVPLEMMKFVNAGGKKLQGLVNRRAAEVMLWSTQEPGSAPEDLPSSVTRVVETPPTPADPNPPTKSKPVIAAAATVITTGAAAVDPVMKAVQPYAAFSPTVSQILAGLAIFAAICAGVSAFLVWRHNRKARN